MLETRSIPETKGDGGGMRDQKCPTPTKIGEIIYNDNTTLLIIFFLKKSKKQVCCGRRDRIDLSSEIKKTI